MNHYDLCRRWASDNRKPYGKSSSMFYEGDTIYSWGYHWPLAKKVTLSDSGRTVALVHNRSHTSSTNKHLGHVTCALGWNRFEYVTHDLFDSVTDEESLAKAKHRTLEEDKDIAYEARLARNARAKRDREHNACMARQELERLLGVDLDNMSNSACIALRNRLVGVPDNNFQAQSWWRRGQRHGGLAEVHPELVTVLAKVIEDDPSVVKRPGYINTLIENFQLLAA